MKSKIDSAYIRHDMERICQGDILRDFRYIARVSFERENEKKKIKMKWLKIPYLVVLTQDCDLKLDHENHNNQKENHDKFLQSILVCPAYHAEKLREGTHLEALGLKMQRINSARWNFIEKNQNPRYHFLKGNRELQVPELAIDFKHYYTIQRDLLYEEIKDYYFATINELFREALSQRFAYYLSRIGLPLIT